MTFRFLQNSFKRAAAPVLAATLTLPVMTQAGHNSDIITADSATSYSQSVARLQQHFNRAAPDTDIVVIDRDWFEINRTLNSGPAHPDEDELGAKLLAELTEQQTGRRFPAAALQDMAAGAGDVTAQAHFNPYESNDNGLRGLCIVSGHRAEMSGPDQMTMMLGLRPGQHGPALDNAAIRQPLPADVLNKLTDYHEIGHCMDRWYLPEALERADYGRNRQAFILNRHKAEMYADIFALLMLARDGAPDILEIADRRANMRLVYMALAGPEAVRATAIDDPMQAAPYMYAIHEGIWGARDEIARRGPDQMRALSVDEIRTMARTITEDHAIGHEGAPHAVTYMLRQQYDLSAWELIIQAGGFDYIEERYNIAKSLMGQMDTALRAMLDLDHIPSGQNVLETLAFNRVSLRPEGPPQAAIEAATTEMTRQIRHRAGGVRASQDQIIAAYSAVKDGQRALLRSDSESARQRATLNLDVMGEALLRSLPPVRKARYEIQAPAAAPAPQQLFFAK